MTSRTKEQLEEFLPKVVNPDNTAENTAKFYDEWAKNYDTETSLLGYRGPELFGKHFPKFQIPKDARIIEIGCGTGLVGQQLHNLGYHNLEGLDGSAGMLAEAEKKNIYKKLHHHLVNGRLPLDKESYDVAILYGCIHDGHIRKEVINDVTEILKKGGLIIKECRSPDDSLTRKDERLADSVRSQNGYIEQLISDGLLRLHGERLLTEDIVHEEDKFRLEVFEALRNAHDNPVRNEVLEFQTKLFGEMDIQCAYDTWGKDYDEHMKYMNYHGTRIFRDYFVKQNFPKTSKILDVGCGTGRLGQFLYDAGYTNLEGLDGSSGMLEEAKKKGIYKNVYHCLVNGPLPLPEASYDGVVWIGCVAPKHIPMEIVKYVTKIIKPGGFLAMDKMHWGASADPQPEIPPEMQEYVQETMNFVTGYAQQLKDLQASGVLERVGEEILTRDELYDGMKFAMDVFKVLKAADF